MDGFPGAILIGGEEPPQATGFYNADGTWRALFKPTERIEEGEIPPPKEVAGPTPASGTIEICRSFAYKISLQNYGGNQYESADFFCSRKMACKVEVAAMVSESLFEDCLLEIQGSIRKFISDAQSKRAAQVARAEAERAEHAALQQQGLVTRPTAHPTGRRRV